MQGRSLVSDGLVPGGLVGWSPRAARSCGTVRVTNIADCGVEEAKLHLVYHQVIISSLFSVVGAALFILSL